METWGKVSKNVARELSYFLVCSTQYFFPFSSIKNQKVIIFLFHYINFSI
jgi:hypothetical protein